ncbi:MAG: ATPase, partial [Streptomyces sp.]|nr:ATPase [Streptomyces sp.]
ANPPTVDAAISQRMGLFVVGRLSDRHGIRVQLRPSGEQAGTTSLVMLPDAITHGGGGEQQAPVDEFTVSQIIPEQQQYQGEDFNNGLPMRTAAELGFDDSRYSTEIPDDIRELDPVGRSLMREERRAALEAQAHPTEPGQETPAAPSYGNEFDARPAAYDNGQNGYQEPAAYEEQQSAYADPQRTAYEEPRQPAYDEQYYAPNGGLPQGDTFSSNGGGYPEPTYAEPAQEESAAVHGSVPESFPAFEERRYQDDWPQQDGYQNGYQDQYAPEAESAQAADVSERDHVGFDRPGPGPSAVHELTDSGLPRRGSGGGARNGTSSANGTGGTTTDMFGTRSVTPQSTPSAPESNGSSNGTGNGDWRSANDARWQQASALKKPKAGGVTSSGLPRRVPKANLVEGAAETTPQGGPQVSRAPEDVRGRLSNLRRGVQRGRSAGSETNGQGLGPDSTYNQER